LIQMLKWFRARAGTWALVALCSFTTVGALSTIHELQCGDELAEAFVVGHTPGSHTVSAAHVAQKPAHCVLCHWLQSFRAGGLRASRFVIAHESRPARTLSPVQHVRTVAPLDLPSRAPPA
jgi:hypothetical protein